MSDAAYPSIPLAYCVSNFRRLCAAILFVTFAPAIPLADAYACGEQNVPDSKGDVIILGAQGTEPTTGNERPSIDFVNYTLAMQEEGLQIVATLVQRPGQGEEGYNRYWLGFHADAGHGAEYMDVRIHRTSTYDSGMLVGPNRLGNADWGEVEITWSDAQMSLVIPWELLEKGLSAPFTVGQPRASSEGPSMTTTAQGFIAGAVLGDWVYGRGEYTAITPCPIAETHSIGPGDPVMHQPRGAPTLGPLMSILVLAALVLRARVYRRPDSSPLEPGACNPGP